MLSRVLIVVALLALAARVDAAVCSTGAVTLLDCQAARASCRWDEATNACINGAPTSCSEYFTDYTGCTVTALTDPITCVFNTVSGRCFTRPQLCGTFVDETFCGTRSDCVWTTVCEERFFDDPNACTVQTDIGTCSAHGCYWDPFIRRLDPLDTTMPTAALGQCLYALSEVTQYYQCAFWSGYPRDPTTGVNSACLLHGCGQQGNTCLTVTPGVITPSGDYAVSSVIQYAWLPPAVDPLTLVFRADVLVPLSVFWQPTAPVRHAIVVGVPNASDLDSYLTPGPCTSVLSLPRTAPSSTYPDPAALYAYFLAQVQATHNLSFPDADARHSAINAIIGEYRLGAGSLLDGADIPSGLVNIALHARGNLNTWATQCRNVTKVIAPTYTAYSVPLTVVSLSGAGNSAGSTQRFTVTVGTYGSISISATSSANKIASIEDVIDGAFDCPVGQQRRTWTIREEYRALDATRVIGLRSLADVAMYPTGGVFTAGAPLNCFGSEPFEVLPPSACPGSVCVTR
ncbi:MAG: hypothetical protein Q7V62_13850, partial [Actinomycetota bacterium]|nr:hypothetical protein [Actinomycetota bacterium]